jgi:hypothetical protein
MAETPAEGGCVKKRTQAQGLVKSAPIPKLGLLKSLLSAKGVSQPSGINAKPCWTRFARPLFVRPTRALSEIAGRRVNISLRKLGDIILEAPFARTCYTLCANHASANS